MSWSTHSGGPVAKDAIDPAKPHLSDTVADEQRAQYDAALAAARAIAATVGRPDDRVTVRLSGHANPGHGPRPGWAHEVVTVTVEAVPAE